MFRIGVHNGNDSTSFTIEGKLTASGASELEKCWQSAIADEPLKSVVVNLVRVTFIDVEGKELLMRLCRRGATLVPTGCLMKVIVEQIEGEVAQERLSSETYT